MGDFWYICGGFRKCLKSMSRLSRHNSFRELKAAEKSSGTPNSKLQKEFKEFIAELQDILSKSKTDRKGIIILK